MVDATPRESVLGSGSGGPLSLPTPWKQGPGYITYTDGGVVVGNPTGGNKGIGTINAQTLYTNGAIFDPTKYLLLVGGTLTGALTLFGAPVNPLDAATKKYVDDYIIIINTTFGNYLPLAGGTLTGPLTLAADPAIPLGAVTKQYADRRLPLAGGTMTGPLLLAADPTVALGASTKQYVDAHTFADAISDGNTYARRNAAWARSVALAGDTMTGALVLAADPITGLGAATKNYVDAHSGTGGITDAPSDGSYYGRLNGGWLKVLGLPGGTLTGPLILAADPTAALGAVTKQYSDKNVPLAGGTMTGLLLLSADPGAALGAATKQYVDAHTGIPSGTVMIFYQATAPVGWTKVTTQNDKALRVVSGATGGSAAGTNAFSTVMGQAVVGSHTLDASEIPTITSNKNNNIIMGTPSSMYLPLCVGAWSFVTDTPGSDPGHAKIAGSGSYANSMTTTNNIAVNSNNTGGGAHNHSILMDIQYCDVIIASKN